jgi:amino-acid racemase
MKQIGILGGMSWESTKEYYRILNELAAQRLGGLHSAECLIASVDFAPLAQWMHSGRWDLVGELLTARARALEAGGAELLLIGTNTMHLLAEEIQAAVAIPLLHIADAAGEECLRLRVKTVALLGTKFTMEKGFYADRLAVGFGLSVLTPEPAQRLEIDRIIFDEHCAGHFLPESTARLRSYAEELVAQGAEAVILGCTELPLVLHEGDLPVPVLNTTELHAREAFDRAVAV